MKKIESFTVDHTKIDKGMYISRVDGDIVTYDLRMVRPNTPPYLENAGLHSLEHLFATYARNSEYSDSVIYVGPMGCRTGFYFLVRGLAHEKAIALVIASMEFIAGFEGDIPGASELECGNHLDHDPEKAREYAKGYLEAICGWSPDRLTYPQ